MAKKRKNVKGKKVVYQRRRFWRLFYVVFSFVLIVVVLVSSFSLFFRMEKVQILGNQRYSYEEILQVVDLPTGMNLFLVPKSVIENKLYENMPYIQSVKVKLNLPVGIKIEMVESVATSVFQLDGRYWLADASGKILEEVDTTLANEHMYVEGISVLEQTVGKPVNLGEGEEKKLRALQIMIQSLQKAELLEKVIWIDLSIPEEIKLGYVGGYTIGIPSRSTTLESSGELYDLKLEALKQILPLLDENVSGHIDLWEDKAFFRPT